MKWLTLSLYISVMGLSMMGCADPYGDAQKLGTVEAYEQFIKENEGSARVFEARLAIEKLMTDKARETQEMADFDAYLNKFRENPPSKTLYQKMVVERQSALFSKAEKSNSVEDWENFIEEYKGNPQAKTAKQRLAVAKYLPNLKMDPMEKTQINLSGDDNGALDGWAFETNITNSGDKDISKLLLQISFLDVDGKVLKNQTFTVIGCGDYCQRMFVFDDPSYAKQEPEIGRIKPPFKKGESRQFYVTTGDIPPGWAKKVDLTFTGISFND